MLNTNKDEEPNDNSASASDTKECYSRFMTLNSQFILEFKLKLKMKMREAY